MIHGARRALLVALACGAVAAGWRGMDRSAPAATIAHPVETVWQAAIATFEEIGYSPIIQRRERHLLIGERALDAATLPEIVTDPIAWVHNRWAGGRLRLIVSIEQTEEGSTRLRVDSHVEAHANRIDPAAVRAGLGIVPMQSRGVVEREWRQALEAKLRAR